MGAISSFATSFDALRRNPVLLVAAFLAALLGSLSMLGQLGGIAVSLGLSLVSMAVTPFIMGGMLGMAEEAVDDRTRLATFVDEGVSNYLSLLGAFLVLLGVLLAVTIVFGIISVVIAVVGTFALASGSGAGGVAGMGFGIGSVVLVLVFLLGILAVSFFLQFFDAAVVVGGAGAIGSLKHSARFVRANWLGALGFLAIYVVISLLASIPSFWLSFQSMGTGTPMAVSQAMGGPTLAEIAPVLVATVVISTFTSALLYTYKVSFYTSASANVAAN